MANNYGLSRNVKKGHTFSIARPINRHTHIRAYTTPNQLRAIADAADLMWSRLRLGDDVHFHTFHLFNESEEVSIELCFNQDHMPAYGQDLREPYERG